jgi:hypothetical protein
MAKNVILELTTIRNSIILPEIHAFVQAGYLLSIAIE